MTQLFIIWTPECLSSSKNYMKNTNFEVVCNHKNFNDKDRKDRAMKTA